MLKREDGITFWVCVITVIVLIIIGTTAARAGISTYNDSKVKTYIKEMEMIKEKINLVAGKAEINSEFDFNKIGSAVDGDDEAKKCLKAVGVEESDFEKYRVLSTSTISSTLGLEDIDRPVVLNLKTRQIYSITPIKYDGNLYYSVEDIRK